MRGFHGRQHLADGGVVQAIKRRFQSKPAHPQQPTEKPESPSPESLGNGMAGKAARSLADRKKMLEEAMNYADGGIVRGPGTGTSDDIETEVPEGSYIMPADSTRKVGERNLAALGFGRNVPVNLSNGEYQMPPEQVHAVGVQVLDQIKNATHTPAAEGAPKPRHFFRDGGLVDDALKYYGGASKATVGALAYPFAAAGEAVRDLAIRAADGDPRSNPNQTKYSDAAAEFAGQGTNQMGEVVDAAKAGVRGFFGVDRAKPAAPAPAKPAADPAPAVAANPPALAAAAPAGSANSPKAEPVQPLANNVTREGNSYSGANIGPGFTINGQQPGGGFAVVPGNVPPALTPAQPSMATGFQTASPSGNDFAWRNDLLDPRTTAIRNHAVGAKTDRQRAARENEALASILGEDKLRTDARSSDARNAADLMREGMQQEGDNTRAAFTNAIAAERLALDREAQGFKTRAAQRIERLYEQYEAAKTPGERSAIAEQIRVLNGKDQPARYAVAAGGQIVDPTTQQLVTQPAIVYNQQTGEIVERPSATQHGGATGQQAPRPGETRGGYRFKGGNPADQNNWEKV